MGKEKIKVELTQAQLNSVINYLNHKYNKNFNQEFDMFNMESLLTNVLSDTVAISAFKNEEYKKAVLNKEQEALKESQVNEDEIENDEPLILAEKDQELKEEKPLTKEDIKTLIGKVGESVEKILKTEPYNKLTVRGFEGGFKNCGFQEGTVDNLATLYTSNEGIKAAKMKRLGHVLHGDKTSPAEMDYLIKDVPLSEFSGKTENIYEKIFDVKKVQKDILEDMKKDDPEKYKNIYLGGKPIHPTTIESSVYSLSMMSNRFKKIGFLEMIFHLPSYFKLKNAISGLKNRMVEKGFDRKTLDDLTDGRISANGARLGLIKTYYEKNDFVKAAKEKSKDPERQPKIKNNVKSLREDLDKTMDNIERYDSLSKEEKIEEANINVEEKLDKKVSEFEAQALKSELKKGVSNGAELTQIKKRVESREGIQTINEQKKEIEKIDKELGNLKQKYEKQREIINDFEQAKKDLAEGKITQEEFAKKEEAAQIANQAKLDIKQDKKNYEQNKKYFESENKKLTNEIMNKTGDTKEEFEQRLKLQNKLDVVQEENEDEIEEENEIIKPQTQEDLNKSLVEEFEVNKVETTQIKNEEKEVVKTIVKDDLNK